MNNVMMFSIDEDGRLSIFGKQVGPYEQTVFAIFERGLKVEALDGANLAFGPQDCKSLFTLHDGMAVALGQESSDPACIYGAAREALSMLRTHVRKGGRILVDLGNIHFISPTSGFHIDLRPITGSA